MCSVSQLPDLMRMDEWKLDPSLREDWIANVNRTYPLSYKELSDSSFDE